MAKEQAFITYQEAARLTGKTIRTIRRKIHSGIIAESQTRKRNGQVMIAVAELVRVFGEFRPQGADSGGDRAGQGRTFVPDTSGTSAGIWREYLDFTKQQLEWEQRRNDRLESAVDEMRRELQRTQEQLSRLLPEAGQARTAGEDKPGQERGQEGADVRPPRRWLFWKRYP